MEQLPRRVYTAEFRRRAVETVTREGLGIAEASRRLSLSPKTLANRVGRAVGADSPGPAAPRREVTEAEAEAVPWAQAGVGRRGGDAQPW